MTTQTLTITDFLLARIADDEATLSGRRDSYDVPHALGCDYPGDMPGYCDCDLASRMLAECAAKRAIVERAACDCCAVSTEAEWTLRVLAYPFADHPDYDESWRP